MCRVCNSQRLPCSRLRSGTGVVHGVIGHHGKKEEEMEEELGQEVKRQEEENAQTPVRMTMTMDEIEKTLRGLEPM